MTTNYRAFTAEDIPVSLMGCAIVFNWSKLADRLHNNIGQSPYINIMQTVNSVMDELHGTDSYNEQSLRVNIAARLNANFYPIYFGIKKEVKDNPEFPGKMKYVDIDALLANDTYLPKEESKVFDATPYMQLLIDQYGFTFEEAQKLLFQKNFTLDDIMILIKNVVKKTEERTKDMILNEAIKRFTK